MELVSPLRTVRFGQCFGWLHIPPGGRSNGTAIILCAGLSADGLTGYRPLRLLANALAAAGYPTLRFDYPGTGNSGDCDTPDAWMLWRSSIHAAIDWLRDHGLAEGFVLCGLRAGATLALEVSATCSDLAGLLLLEPVLRGQSYLRQLALEAGGNVGEPSAGGPISVNGVELSVETVMRMQQIDLRRSWPATSCPICVFTQSPGRLLSDCMAAWQQAGASVQRMNFSGLEAMLRPVLMSHMASIEAAPVLDWLDQVAPAKPAVLELDRLPDETSLVRTAFIETPVHFGPRQELFGILCEPRPTVETQPAVVITNSSGNPSSGFGRFGVELARGLAAAGFASLRMDFTGLGDSIAPSDRPTHIFEVDRSQELRSAIDLLAARGYRRIAAQGLCSGAYHVLHAAFEDRRISALLLVNLQHLTWAEGDRVELEGYALRHPKHFLKKLGSGSVWINLLRGRFDLAGIVSVQLARCSDELGRLASNLLPWPRRQAKQQATITDRMQILSLRARTLFLMSNGDEGIAVLGREFGSALTPPGALVEIVPDLDHALSTAAMRKTVINRLIGFLQEPVAPAEPVLQSLLETSTV